MPPHLPIAVVVVTHNSAGHISALLRSLLSELSKNDEIVIVDNASADGTAQLAHSSDQRVRVIETHSNLGFAGGCHVGARSSTAPLLLLLNPDCQVQTGCLDRLRVAASNHPDWGAWQAAVLLDERLINTSGGVVHYLGAGWAGGCDQPVAALPSSDGQVAFASGAAMVVRRAVWEQLGGLDERYFMYGEDLDLGLRLWLAGHAVGLVPTAHVVHGYEFDKGQAKWFWLERNRFTTVLSVYPLPLLLLLAPALLLAEPLLLLVAARNGWLSAKLRAQLAVLGGLPGTLARRRRIQATRHCDSATFAAHLTSSLESPYLPALNRWLTAPQAVYWTLVRACLKILRSPRRRKPQRSN